MTSRRDTNRQPVDGAPSEPGLFERIAGARQGHERRVELAALAIAMAFHLGGAAQAATNLADLSHFAQRIRAAVTARMDASIEIEREIPAPPEQPPAPEEEEPEVEEPTEETEPVPSEATEVSGEPPPAAAEAGQVLTAEADPDEPLDLTGDGFLSGTGTRFAGGITASDGTAKTAVRNRSAQGSGAVGAQGKVERASGPPPVDKSKPAGLPPNANWRSCGFPSEADAEQVHQGVVRVVVVVSATGKPTSVSVLSDPGYGFGRVARSCAMRWAYPPGLDKLGNPVATATRPFVINFIR